MDCDCKDKYGGRLLNGSKSSFHEDDPKMNSAPNASTLPNTEFSNKNECTSMCPKDSELSSTEDLSGKENSCLFSSLGTSNPLAFDLEVHIQNVPVELKRPFKNILSSPDRDICSPDGLPICTQLPANHLKHSHSTAYKTRHRHRGIRFSTSTSRSQQSLKPPGEDLCASFLLACLFCKFWDCVLTVGDGCQYCLASICSSICSKACCCDPSAVDVFVDFCPCCSCAEYMEVCGCSCGESAFDCSICDLCLQTTECLELGMELSQLLFH
ncbi:myoD family inhibitor [Triplophysa dalaica]|uniref:myoD family inhibitor n=1 Tax=Triplophysa dalaica TaxID=1582913 RepID=UPI0024DF81CB|nr:myoD family inhibitor [Triplophysa dalaica]